MDIILANRDKLEFTVDRDYGYTPGKGYICGPRGYQGGPQYGGHQGPNAAIGTPGSSKLVGFVSPDPEVEVKIPEGLMLEIKCGDNKELLELLKENVHRLQEKDVEIRVGAPQSITKWRIKPEYVEIDKQNILDDEARVEKAKDIIRGLLELNVTVDFYEINFNEYHTPQYYFEVESEETDYTNAGIYVLSHSGTKFYDTMLREGILRQAVSNSPM